MFDRADDPRPSALPRSLASLAALALGAPIAAQCTEGCTVIHMLEGEVAGDQYGWVSNDIGDVDDDGIHDFVLTAPTNDAGGANAGRIYVYSGASGEELWRDTGRAAGWWLGHDANEAGDLNGDEIPDVIAGAPFFGTGRIIVYSGDDGTQIRELFGNSVGDQFGFRVHGGGDFDGDGQGDIIVGAPLDDSNGNASGTAFVYSGADFTEICAIAGLASNENSGSGVTFIGDVNGDGRDDVAVGARNADGGGGLARVHAWDGKACQRLYTLDPGPVSNNFGQWFMNGGHDVNRDGTPDIYVNDFGVNRAHIFSGVDGSKIWELNGNGEGGGFGIGRIVEDVDGDCFADMILAAWISSVGAPSAGKAFIYSGRTGEILDTYTHDVANAGFGFDANGMGDVDGDGQLDYLVTAASDNQGRGTVYLLAGNIAKPLTADVTRDGSVDFADIVALLGSWGECAPPPAECPADIDCSGVVDFADILAILANWS